MYTLVIGRAFPRKETGMMGIFEFEQAVALNKHGMRTVYAFCDTRSIKRLRKYNYEEFEEDNVSIYGYHFPIGGIPRFLFEKTKSNKYMTLLKKIFNKHGKPSHIHIHFPLITMHQEIWEYLVSLNIPIFITEHWSKVQTKELELFRVKLLKSIVAESQAFICVSELLKNSVVELTRTTKCIKVVPNIINNVFYYDSTLCKENKGFHFIAIGRIVEVKRFLFTIKAFAKAFPTEEQIKLQIVGDGPLLKDLKEYVRVNRLEERVIFHGFQPREKTSGLLRNSDAFISASVLETFGVPFIEAMACGKPFIAADNSPILPYVKDKIGYIFQVDNKDSLIDEMRKLYNDRKLINNEKIALYAQKKFSEEIICSKIIDIYKSV